MSGVPFRYQCGRYSCCSTYVKFVSINLIEITHNLIFPAQNKNRQLIRLHREKKGRRRMLRRQNEVLEGEIKILSKKLLCMKKKKIQNNIYLAKVKRTCQVLRKAINEGRQNVLQIEKSIDDLSNIFSESDSD